MTHHAAPPGLRRAILLTSIALTGAAILELLAREVARRSILDQLTGWHPSAWTVGVIAAIAAAVPGTMITARTKALFAALFAVGLAAQLSLGARLQSDGFYYFAYLRSLAFDGDVDFRNDYRLLGLGPATHAHLFQPTPTGYAHSAWTIGPAIVWAPFFAGGHAVAVFLSRRDPDVSANGISFPYRQAVSVAGLFYGLLGCWFMYRFAARFFDARLAAAAPAVGAPVLLAIALMTYFNACIQDWWGAQDSAAADSMARCRSSASGSHMCLLPRRGVNRVSLNFAWERRPADVGAGGDGRFLAAAIDYVRVAVPER